MIDNLRIEKDQVVRLAVCGNPIQLSLFEGNRDQRLSVCRQAQTGGLGVVPPKRDAQIVKAPEIRGLDLSPEVDVMIPPAVEHEIGADALAMMIQTGMLEKKKSPS